MKKHLFLFVIFVASTLTACGSGTAQTQTETTTATALMAPSSESQETRSDSEALNDLGAERGLFNVELNIPKEFAGERTQEELNATAKEVGYKAMTLNDDGSVTFVMTKSQHREIMVGIKDSINSSIEDMVGSENYPNFTNISTNDNFTDFKITTKSTELNLAESLSVLGFYMYGGMYSAFNGTPIDNISVSFVNAESGEIISTSNSSDTE